MKATVPEAVREALYLELPEDQIPKERRLDLAMARAVAALASAEGPARVEVEGIGDFSREQLPPIRLPIVPPSPHDGWLPKVADLPEPPPPVRDLVVGETHRYVRHLDPGAW